MHRPYPILRIAWEMLNIFLSGGHEHHFILPISRIWVNLYIQYRNDMMVLDLCLKETDGRDEYRSSLCTHCYKENGQECSTCIQANYGAINK